MQIHAFAQIHIAPAAETTKLKQLLVCSTIDCVIDMLSYPPSFLRTTRLAASLIQIITQDPSLCELVAAHKVLTSIMVEMVQERSKWQVSPTSRQILKTSLENINWSKCGDKREKEDGDKREKEGGDKKEKESGDKKGGRVSLAASELAHDW